MKAHATSGGGFGVSNGLPQGRRNTIASPDDADANAIFDAARGFRQEIFVQQAKDAVDFGERRLPVRGRKREQCKRVNTELGCSLDDRAAGFGSGAVPGRARQSAMRGPASVAVGNDGNMQGLRRHRWRRAENVLQNYLLRGHGNVPSPPRRVYVNNFTP